MEFENLQKNMAMINYKCRYYKQALEDGNEEQLENKIPEEIILYFIHDFTKEMETSIRLDTSSIDKPEFINRLQTIFIFSPTSIMCLSGS